MVYLLAARAYLMSFDNDLLLDEAISWVVRRFPKGLREYYHSYVRHIIISEILF